MNTPNIFEEGYPNNNVSLRGKNITNEKINEKINEINDILNDILNDTILQLPSRRLRQI
jgi:hypothetical protein